MEEVRRNVREAVECYFAKPACAGVRIRLRESVHMPMGFDRGP